MQEREEVICMMNKRLSENDSEQLSVIPYAQEVEKVVFGMARYKSTGYDGLTTDVVCECWDFLGSACVQLVQTIWAKKRILRADCHGIIKLIPKPGEKRFLSNWRPISLMNWTYKLISKILANRVRDFLPKLVTPQQAGFVKGRYITDNILSMKTGQEWKTWTSQDALFVKIDFIKAYDRIDHIFLWEVLKKAGFNQHFLQLVQGFTCGGQTRVHVTGGFTPDIQIACRENFAELLSILVRYELVSRAKVNLSQSLIMPFGCSEAPAWVRLSGCDIVGAERTFKYLGVRMGVPLGGNDSIQEAIRRLNSRILQWENYYLPWTARLVLIKHVLSLIPTYIMLAVGCDKKDANRLEQYCRQFLWAVNTQGLPKSL
ncbi:hypothetical protein R1sor_025731 [Riccia sorocarpa]|uniref:Reverse transcriptase domain-containing protein n=1 Tax=Riccia sorocarpa TaxID=122646 RepID=A0ABD3G9F5_9MARC